MSSVHLVLGDVEGSEENVGLFHKLCKAQDADWPWGSTGRLNPV